MLSDPRGRNFAALMLFVIVLTGSRGGRYNCYAVCQCHTAQTVSGSFGTWDQLRIAKHSLDLD